MKLTALFILSVFSGLKFESEKMEIIREGNSRVTHLIGKVHFYDNQLDIKGEEAWYSTSENSLIVKDSLVIMAQGDTKITADSLYFDTRKRTSYLYRRVVVTRDQTRISGPALIIDHKKKEARIPRMARIQDLKEGMVVTGDDVVFDLDQNKGSILASPVLTDDTQDSDFKVTGGRMHLDQVNKVVAAAEHVTVLSDEATVTCDTLTLFYENNKGDAFGNVVLSNPDGRVDADSADFTILDRRLEEINLYPQVVTRYRTEGSDSVTLTSRSLTMDLREEKKEVMYFTGGVSGIYYWIEETPQE